MMEDLLGKTVDPWGKVVAVTLIDGQRYYWLVKDDNWIAVLPAALVEDTGRLARWEKQIVDRLRKAVAHD